MPTCALPLLERHFLTTASGALLGALLAAIIGHGILRTFLEARGVAPWSVLDSLGSMPLIVVGAAAVGAAAALMAEVAILHCADTGWQSLASAAGVTLTLGGLLMLRLGLLALRKLT